MSYQAQGSNHHQLWFGPGVAWLILLALFALNLFSSYVPLGVGNLVANLVIAAMMIAIVFVVLMDLKNAKALIRVTAASGLLWLIFMFALTFNDYLSRHY